MKKTVKKLLSVVLALSLVFSICTVAFSTSAANYFEADSVEDAAKQLAAMDSEYPLVILPGINHSPVYLCDENNEVIYDEDGNSTNGTLLLVDTSDLVPSILKNVAVPLILMLLTQSDCGLANGLKKLANDLLSLQKTNPDGSLVNNLQLKDFHFPLSEFDENSFDGEYDNAWFYRMLPMQAYTDVVGEDEVFLYTFNLVGNVMDSAKGLYDFIEFVKDETGKDKVNLLNVSLGGTVFTAYMDLYDAYEQVENIVSVVAVHDGTSIIGDFFKREWNLSDKSLYSDLFPYILGIEADSAALGYLVNILIRIIPRAELELMLTSVYDVLFENLLHNSSQIWAMIPSSYYPELAERYLSTDEYATLKKSTDAFYQAQLDLVDNLKKFVNKGGSFNAICGYGLQFGEQEYSFFALANSYDKVNSDGIIEIQSTSIGATWALPGEKLENPNPKYVSPDGSIDVSTCAFPDNTWLFENQHHEIGGNDAALKLACELILDDDLKDVNSNPSRWPQFNGTRNTKYIRRWRLDDYERLDRSTCTAEQLAELDAAYAEVMAMLDRTIVEPERDAAVAERFDAALVLCGVLEAEEDTTTRDNILTAVAKFASDLVYKFVGPKGFFD